MRYDPLPIYPKHPGFFLLLMFLNLQLLVIYSIKANRQYITIGAFHIPEAHQLFAEFSMGEAT